MVVVVVGIQYCSVHQHQRPFYDVAVPALTARRRCVYADTQARQVYGGPLLP